MVIRKFAAIDIGSNAIRLLINNVIEQENKPTAFKKSELVRVPVRLGEDAFLRGKISERNMDRLVKTMKSFDLLMQVYGVEKYMACATSALREAKNGREVVDRVMKEAGMKIELIDGKKEALIIASTDLKDIIKNDRMYLYVDVGGGSTEFTIFDKGKPVMSHSFKIGTVRILSNLVDDTVWEEIKAWIKTNVPMDGKLEIIGSGGNINKLHKMSGRKIGQPLSYIWLNAQYHFLNSMAYEDRISELGLNQDRADVIIPATRIFLNAAKWSKAKKIHVPKIGLADGMIKTLYYQ
ncbi:exopolyphosphatase / guanosine-5'-triphosphate,3'-diphosphate pyrophosphatase [Flagellimonas taeanensis]|uniref:Exopolyphosphatase / guanosine-5'-triphosphate,3'-diphosphate pyrophosphatase n=1 Tax=Flagellimonas taeanensis TaxID=1005926 RepID=A0A1M7CG66_9FLAO|nr:exopolyphosphatase [Allomuricauda taeanensis]MEE1964478.1 exopolyphosphatase [Allomuricauda taeanensis]SFC62665.1 exopolyphosphatase / guanosine-5'-triphosphate,3'-diphosphate pyrophosphatase [Allomuricauda taeanensis]SHL66271.1 exopolyphosphatase / guanosine-5'-triphosphate,3'-diphosphate pyrophosphatase [Allomuricauda taeanensis]